MSKQINIGGRIHSTEVGNVAVGANEVLDDTKGQKQNVINSETDAELLRLDQSKQNNLTFDNTPTENSNNPVKSSGVYAADKALSDAIEAILLLIPSAATALNQLADKAFVNSSVSTATATFRGTYNVVTDLELAYDASHEQIATKLGQVIATADNNDYAFVQVPVSATSTDIRRTERYKFNGTVWGYEYDLNTSGFTQAQWEAINSAITVALVQKLAALPTAQELAAALLGKQDVLTFDNVPTTDSSNPVKSGGVKSAINDEKVARENADTGIGNRITAIENVIPSAASSSNKLVDNSAMADAIGVVTALIGQMDATFNLTTTDGHITLHVTQENGVITSVQVQSSDIASAAALTLVANDLSALTTRVGTAEGNITSLTGRVSTNEIDIANLQQLYNNLQQSKPVPVEALPETGQQQGVIYRLAGTTSYSDYMWNGSSWVLMATYNNAIDNVPVNGSGNLVKSGGVYNFIYNAFARMNPSDGVVVDGYIDSVSGVLVAYGSGTHQVYIVNIEDTDTVVLNVDNSGFADKTCTFSRENTFGANAIDGVHSLNEGDNVLIKPYSARYLLVFFKSAGVGSLSDIRSINYVYPSWNVSEIFEHFSVLSDKYTIVGLKNNIEKIPSLKIFNDTSAWANLVYSPKVSGIAIKTIGSGTLSIYKLNTVTNAKTLIKESSITLEGINIILFDNDVVMDSNDYIAIYCSSSLLTFYRSGVGVGIFIENASQVNNFELAYQLIVPIEKEDNYRTLPYIVKNAYVDSVTGKLVNYGEGSHQVNFYDIGKVEWGTILKMSVSNNVTFSIVAAFYGNDKENAINGVITCTNGVNRITVPDGALYFAVLSKFPSETGSDSDFSLSYDMRGCKERFSEIYDWSDKIWFLLGDSLTERNLRATKWYYDFISMKTGVNFLNYGSSGQGYVSGHYFEGIISAIPDLPSFDFITIFGSVNDVRYEEYFGDSITWEEALGTVNDTTTATICGCINKALNKYLEVSPLKKIGVITPTPCKNVSYVYQYTDAETYRRIEMYSNKIVEICRKKGIPCLDLFHESGLQPYNQEFLVEYYKEHNLQDDGTHPNTKGMRWISNIIFRFVEQFLID